MPEQSTLARLEQARVALDTVRRTLDTAIDQAKAWQANPDVPPTEAEIQQHRDLLLMAYARHRVLQSDYEALLRLNAGLLHQHQSAKDAYQAGWNAWRIEIEARATSEECAVLRRLFAEIDNEDSWPF